SQFQVFASEITALAAEYAAHKKRANAVDFDDLLANLDELLVGHPEVAERLSSQFRYILVDEYQDTNPVQAAIVDRLAAVHKNILVVGDDAQSIYSFRAATVENILSFPRRFPGARVFRLETNYRSAPEILELANEVIAKNERQFSKTLRPSAPSAGKPELIAAASSSAEAVFVAETMRRLVAGGLAANRLAALFRATHHSQELEFELSKRGIAYDYRGGMKFFERAHIKDAAAFLRLRANPRDTVSWLRTLPLVSGIGETGAARLAERLKTLENLENIDDALVQGILTGRGAEGWREYREILRRLALAASPEAAVRAILSSTYADYLELEYPDAAERLEDLEQLAIFAGGYRDLESFLAEITLKDDYDAANGARGEKKEERVVLSTIHQAKGLEWDAVFLIHLAAGNFPHVRAVGEDELEEERRLFYVALTRAKRNLYLSYPLRAGTDSWEWSGPSPFLQELDHRLVQESRRSGAGTDEGTNFSEEDTIELDELGERKRPRRGLLRDISDL
ncbi:ATP-dependent helicase, partial [Patescibacteria group bacterium]